MSKKAGVSVTKDDTEKVLEALRSLTKKHVLIGVPAEKDSRSGDPIGNAFIGYINENGSEAARIPPTPHLVPGVNKVSAECADILAKGAAEALSGDTGAMEIAYNKAGIKAQSSVKRVITQQEGFKELSEATLEIRARAGFKGTKRLIWTMGYLNSITYVVRRK